MVNLAEADIGTPRTMPHPKPAAAVYTRVSTEDQAQPDKFSLRQQRERCEAYAKAQGWEVADVYEDAGVSGAKADRPALNRMLADARDGKFQVVIFLKIDRFGRSQRDLHNLAFDLKKHGVAIASATEAIDTSTPSGQAFYGMLAVMAELERAQIAERMASGRLGAARQGRFNCTRTAYGYDYDLKTKKLAINETEAAVVRRIFDLYIEEGLSYVALARRLNAEGVPTKTTEVNVNSDDGIKKGWLNTTVEALIKNPIYRGEAHFNKTQSFTKADGQKGVRARPREEWIPIDCPAIISAATWSAARRRAKKNIKRSQRPKDGVTKFLLGGLLQCHCGKKLYGASSGRAEGKKGMEPRRYLYCAGQKHYGTDCHTGYHDAEAVERAVLDQTLDLFRDPQRVLQHCDDYAEQQRAAEGWSEGQMERLRTELATAEAKRQRAIGLYTDGTISKAQLDIDLRRIDDDNKGHQEELARVEAAARQRKTARDAEQAAWAIAGRIKDVVGELTIEEKKELLREVVEKVTVSREGQPTIEYILRSDTANVQAGEQTPAYL